MSVKFSAKREFEAAKDELTSELVAMFRHATSSGLSPISDHVVQTIDEIGREEGGPSVVGLVEAHLELAKLVYPSTPRGLDVMVPQGGGQRKMPPLARQLMSCSVLAMCATLGLGLSDKISAEQDYTLFHGDGLPLLINLLFLIAAAALGASFHGVYKLSRYLISATYDPLYDPSYWIRLFLGVLSGVLLATMDLGVVGEERFLLAIAGGFSTMLVYRVLEHLVSTFENLLAPGKGSPPPTPQPKLMPEASSLRSASPGAVELGTPAVEVGEQPDADPSSDEGLDAAADVADDEQD